MQTTALVLSGGGVRGAWQVGLVAGLLEVLGRKATDAPPFDAFVGASVGAINATWFAAHTHLGTLGIDGLLSIWEGLKIEEMVRFGLVRWRRDPDVLGRGLLDPGAIDRTVRGNIPWDQLHQNIDSGRTRGLVVPALRISDGRTVMFSDLSPDTEYKPSRDPSRMPQPTRIGADHVLASTALPVIFPPRRIGGHFYADGGLRFNTPIAPALRMGADRLVVLSPKLAPSGEAPPPTTEPPGLAFLAGKVLNALLLDPLSYDLLVLERFNRLWSVLEEALPEHEMKRVQEILLETRGAGYHAVQTLAFRPSGDIGALARTHVRDLLDTRHLGPFARVVLRWVTSGRRPTDEADLAGYVLYDHTFTRVLIAMGRADAHRRADEIRAFFRASATAGPPEV